MADFTSLPIEVHRKIFEYAGLKEVLDRWGRYDSNFDLNFALLCKAYREIVQAHLFRSCIIDVTDTNDVESGDNSRFDSRLAMSEIFMRQPHLAKYVKRIDWTFHAIQTICDTSNDRLRKNFERGWNLMLDIIELSESSDKVRVSFVTVNQYRDPDNELTLVKRDKIYHGFFSKVRIPNLRKVKRPVQLRLEDTKNHGAYLTPSFLQEALSYFEDTTDVILQFLLFEKSAEAYRLLYPDVLKFLSTFPKHITRLALYFGPREFYAGGYHDIYESQYYRGGQGDRLSRAIRMLSTTLQSLRVEGRISEELFWPQPAGTFVEASDGCGSHASVDDMINENADTPVWANLTHIEVRFDSFDPFGHKYMELNYDYQPFSCSSKKLDALFVAASLAATRRMPKLASFHLHDYWDMNRLMFGYNLENRGRKDILLIRTPMGPSPRVIELWREKFKDDEDSSLIVIEPVLNYQDLEDSDTESRMEHYRERFGDEDDDDEDEDDESDDEAMESDDNNEDEDETDAFFDSDVEMLSSDWAPIIL
ncbi:hypothetical protein V1525DRAFT_403629 [Lipomyces kononenkoae]|uniref:Uncharacterized protein n=1 Tax=Lipomyces kononenkoae TaxID=34357 RepID=A0ACC3T115_LIPKO